MFIFHRLKINHESHEFILDPGNLYFWRPSFLILHRRQGGLDTLLARGNRLTLMKGERRESRFERAMPVRDCTNERERKGE